MEVKKEIEQYYSCGYQSLENEFQEQQLEIIKKRYLFKVLDIMNQLDKHIQSNVLKEAGIHYIKFRELHNEIDDGRESDEIGNVQILDKHKNPTPNYITKEKPEARIIKNLLQMTLIKNLYNKEIEGKTITIELNEHTKEKLKHYLLNDELRKVCDYIELTHKMSEKVVNDNKNTKKNKL